MGIMAQQNKELKEREQQNQLKPIIKNLEAKQPVAPKSFADRVPEAAQTVKDALGMKKEVADLTN